MFTLEHILGIEEVVQPLMYLILPVAAEPFTAEPLPMLFVVLCESPFGVCCLFEYSSSCLMHRQPESEARTNSLTFTGLAPKKSAPGALPEREPTYSSVRS